MAAEAEVDAQKAALLSAIAQNGSQGQIAFQAEAARRQAAQQAAVGQIAQQSQMTGMAGSAPKAFTQELQGKQAALGNVYAQDAAMSQQAFASGMANTAAANASYMDAARAAVPVVNAQTAGMVAQIRAEQEAAAAERAAAEEQRQLEREQMDFEREQMALEREAQSTEEKDAAVAEERDAILGRARREATTAVASILEEATTAPDLQSAIVYAQRLIRESNIPGPDGQTALQKGGWKPGFDARDIIRYLYEYYTGEKSPTALDDFGAALQAEGADPKLLPGYSDYTARKSAGGSGSGSSSSSSGSGSGSAGTPKPGTRTGTLGSPIGNAVPVGTAIGIDTPEGVIAFGGSEYKNTPGATATIIDGPRRGKWVLRESGYGLVWVKVG